MKVKFEARFAKDIREITNPKLKDKIIAVIDACKVAVSLAELKQLKKMQGYDTYYRIRIGEYRIGIEVIDDEIIFTRFLHRKDIYKYFPR